MQTQSHFLISAFCGQQVRKHRGIDMPAFLVGSVLPDVPFLLLTIGGEIYYRWFAELPVKTSVMEYLHFKLFFEDPLWIVSHNFFHSFVINGVLLLLGYLGLRWGKLWGITLIWLAISMLFHTTIDIFTHSSDGPLFLFPFNWRYRFPSPISYWESTAYGHWFVLFESTLNILLLGYFAWTWFQHRKHSTARG